MVMPAIVSGLEAETIVRDTLAQADIAVNGHRPWDMQVHDNEVCTRILAEGSLGLGESYMECQWDCDDLPGFFARLLRTHVQDNMPLSVKVMLGVSAAKLFNLQSKSRSIEVAERHYNLGNELYQAMLDKRLVYSCGYWKRAQTLDEAQTAKLDLICRKLHLEPGMRVLDIGCGWGSFARFTAERYRAEVTGITLSAEQAEFARQDCAGLPVQILLQDYRDVAGTFDRVVSIGMFEHVGYKNYATYMEVVNRCLAEDGLTLLHTIGRNHSGVTADPWITKYIFPNSMLPSLRQIAEAAEPYFVAEDLHNFGSDYDKTLLAWHRNFTDHWPQLRQQYDERFFRMWQYYLLSCAGAFRARTIQLWQIVYSKHGVTGGYETFR